MLQHLPLVAEKYTKDGKLWLSVYRNPNNTAHIIRTDVVPGSPALEWDSPDKTPEEWIAQNGPRSQDRWRWQTEGVLFC